MSGGEDLVEDHAAHEEEVDTERPEENFFGLGELAARHVVFLFSGDELVGLERGDDRGEVGLVIVVHLHGSGGVSNGRLFRPLEALSSNLSSTPRPAPSAAFFRRFAAGTCSTSSFEVVTALSRSPSLRSGFAARTKCVRLYTISASEEC